MRYVSKTWKKMIVRAPPLSAAGFAATTISFGPARMGFGLFVPEFRTAFSMSTSSVGLVSSIGFSGFLAGLLGAQALLRRWGPEAPVLLGLIAATIGMSVIAMAPSITVLAFGVFCASSSAGFTWTPFNDAVHRKVMDGNRPAALSTISTGTSVGIALAALAALAVSQSGWSWRASWALFAVASFGVLMVNWSTLRKVEKAPDAIRVTTPWRRFLGARALSLFAIAFVMGTTSAIYIAFAADQMTQAGGVAGLSRATTPALVFFVYGLFGVTGLFTGRLYKLVGLALLLRGAMMAGAVSAAFVVLLPGTWFALVLSAGLQGIHVMMISAVIAFWSERLYPARPSLGFTITLLCMAAGNVLGPVAAGFASDAFGAGPMFLGSGALAFLTAVLLRRRHLVARRETGE